MSFGEAFHTTWGKMVIIKCTHEIGGQTAYVTFDARVDTPLADLLSKAVSELESFLQCEGVLEKSEVSR